MKKKFFPREEAECNKCHKIVTEFCIMTFDDEISVSVPTTLEKYEKTYQEHYTKPILLCRDCYNKLFNNSWEEDRNKSEKWLYI